MTPARVLRLSPGSSALVLVIGRAIARSDVPGLCRRVTALEAGDVVVCDVGALVEVDAGTVDALARLTLAVQRRGGRVRLRHAPSELRELLTLVGLCDVVGLPAD